MLKHVLRCAHTPFNQPLHNCCSSYIMSLEPSGMAGKLTMSYWAASEDPAKAAELAAPATVRLGPVPLAAGLTCCRCPCSAACMIVEPGCYLCSAARMLVCSTNTSVVTPCYVLAVHGHPGCGWRPGGWATQHTRHRQQLPGRLIQPANPGRAVLCTMVRLLLLGRSGQKCGWGC